MHKKTFILALVGILMGASLVDAQDSISVFNDIDAKKAWVVRYGKQTGQGNKREDLAVALRIHPVKNKDGDVVDGVFEGTLFRYAQVIQNKKYIPRPGEAGKLKITGRVINNGNSDRKPIRIVGAGTYVTGEANPEIHVVTVVGMYHPGKKTNPGNSNRDDDRLVVKIRDKVTGGKKGNQGGQNTEAAAADGTFYVALFQDPLPCEEEPDTDILMEETVDPDQESELPVEVMAGFTIAESDGATMVSMGTEDTFTVELDSQPLSDVVLTISSDDTSATVMPTTLTFTETNWHTPQTVTITGASAMPMATITIAVDDSNSDGEYHQVLDQEVTVMSE